MRKPVCTVGVLSDTQTSFGFGLLFSAIKSMTLIADFSNPLEIGHLHVPLNFEMRYVTMHETTLFQIGVTLIGYH